MDETFWGVPKRTAAWLRLDTSTVGIEGNGVEVKLGAVDIPHHESDRKMILGNRVPEGVEQEPSVKGVPIASIVGRVRCVYLPLKQMRPVHPYPLKNTRSE